MRALSWFGPGEVRVVEVPKPRIERADDVVLRVTSAAVCGSDLHALHGKIPKLAPGTVLGHEFVGVVEEAGTAVHRVSVGQRCVGAMFTACGRCAFCLGGRQLRCADYALFGLGELMGGLQGAQAEYVRVPIADMTLCPIPEAMADEAALFTGDILATAYTACSESGMRPGDLVAVVGAGPVGLLTVACARLFGPAQVFAIDLLPDRLELARELGAWPIDASQGEPVELLRQATGGLRADVVIEAVGNQAALETAWKVAGQGATLALVGILIGETWPSSAGNAWLRGLTIKTIAGQPYRHRHTLLRLIERGILQPQAIISERVPLNEAPDAYARMDSRRSLKPVLQVGR